MVAVLMIRCDNPKCKSVGPPEHVPGPGRKRKNERVTAPYGWHMGDGWCVGSGPSYAYMACSDECVGPAVIDLIERAREEDNA
jgi:hypothetical protein